MRMAAGLLRAVALMAVLGYGDKGPAPSAANADAEGVVCVSPAEKAIAEAAKALAEDLICVCEMCEEPSLASCECEFAQKHRGYIVGALSLGFGPDEIVDKLVAKYGNKVLATPPPQGR